MCSVDGCGRPVHRRHLCGRHYKRWLAGRATECTVDGCDRQAVTRSWCTRHYQRWLRHGDPTVLTVRWQRNPPECTVDGCDRKPLARGWCDAHYRRWRAGATVDGPLRRHNTYRCSVYGCLRRHSAGGLCNGHYQRRRRGAPMNGRWQRKKPAWEKVVCQAPDCDQYGGGLGWCDDHIGWLQGAG